ncbi:MAG TPA: hypothetical protein VM736_01030 [Gemmatimonadales bacterium]|nr:hypothetical protein [Gemmatimonadales bacterium]
MIRLGRAVAAFALGVSFVPAFADPSAAQSATDLKDVCKAVGDATLGQWASFDATNPQGGGGGKIRLAVVGSERAGDTTLYWFEVNFAGADAAHSGTLQILNPSLAAGMAAPHAFVFKQAGQPAVKLSGAMAGVMGPKAGEQAAAFDWAGRCQGAHVVGWESVTVPAGTFRTLHLTTDEGAEVWASKDVPFGIVKSRGKQGNMTLSAHGTGAKSSITEKPMEMPGLTTKP